MGKHREELLDLCACYALGILEPEDRARLEAHLAGGCLECEAELERLSEAAEFLASAAPPVDPPEPLRRRILATAARARSRFTPGPGEPNP